MAVKIPVSNLGSYTEIITIDGVAYTIKFDWNSREKSWYLSIFTIGGVALVRGLKVLPGVNMTARFKDTRLPTTGNFICVNTKDSVSAPGRNALESGEVQIWFMTSDEVSNLSNGFAKVV